MTIIIPETVQIEISTVCPFKCVYCPSSDRLTRPKTFMPLEKVEDLILRCKRIGVKAIRVFFVGESSIHPDFLEILKFIKTRSLKIYFATNMYNVQGELADWVADNFVGNYDLLGLTFWSGSLEVHTNITQTGKEFFDRVLANTRYFLDRCSTQAPFFVKVSRTVCELNDTIEEERAYADFFAPWEDRLRSIQEYYAHGFGDISSSYTKRKIPNPRFCKTLNQTMTILVDGTVALCPTDFNGECTLGNAFDGDLLALHNSEKMNNYRENFPTGVCKACGLQGQC